MAPKPKKARVVGQPAAGGGAEEAAPAPAASAAASAKAGVVPNANEAIYAALQADIAIIAAHPAFKKIDAAGALEIDAPASASSPIASPAAHRVV